MNKCPAATDGSRGCCMHFVIPADVSADTYEWSCCACENKNAIAFVSTNEIGRWVEIAKAIVSDSRHSHVTWAAYAAQIGNDYYEGHQRLGNGRHHRDCVTGYDHVIAMLERVA